MARKQRVWYPGAMYHITNRGNRKAALFYDDLDYLTYLEILEESREYFPFYLHSYCLMTNHIHLQVETIQHHPQHMMKMINSRYAVHHNKKYDLEGHVFQGRYGSEIIENTKYELKVSQYIHLNPVEANIVTIPEAYPWSSYAAYITGEENPHVQKDRILGYFANTSDYRKFVEEAQEYGEINLQSPLKNGEIQAKQFR
ncbi:transposase [Virgibacillus kimchii]